MCISAMNERQKKAGAAAAAAHAKRAIREGREFLREYYVSGGSREFAYRDLTPMTARMGVSEHYKSLWERVQRMVGYGLVEKVDRSIYRIREVPFSWKASRLFRKLTNGLLS